MNPAAPAIAQNAAPAVKARTATKSNKPNKKGARFNFRSVRLF